MADPLPRPPRGLDEPVEITGRPGVIKTYRVLDDGAVRYGVVLAGGAFLADVDLDALADQLVLPL
jgi:hypothetical protein